METKPSALGMSTQFEKRDMHNFVEKKEEKEEKEKKKEEKKNTQMTQKANILPLFKKNFG